MRPILAALAVILTPAPLSAQTVPTETSRLGDRQVTIHLHPFLTAEETALLRAVASSEQALALFVTGNRRRHAAIAVAPAEGLVRSGQPVASAFAIADLRTPADARTGALEGCMRARRSGPDCVVVLEVGPAR